MQDPTDTDNNEDALTPEPPQLSLVELRVLGSLMEKQLTTPEQYPLTVNSIITACNQKSSREPVSNYEQGEILRTLQSLEDKHFVKREYGSRADKYSQQFMQHIELGKKQQAVLCVMLLRGPQSLSELSTRTQRMTQFSDRDELMHCLDRLCDRELPYVVRLGPQAGQRGERYGHLFNGMPDIADSPSGTSSSNDSHSQGLNRQDELSHLEADVAELKQQLLSLRSENTKLKDQVEKLYELTGHSSSYDSQHSES